MTTLAGRLRRAIDQQPPMGRSRGIGLLLRKLEDRTVRGATYASMTAYLAGQQQPSLDLLRAVAEVTGVDARWLVLGDGHPTEAHATEASAAAGAAGAEPVADHVVWDLRAGFFDETMDGAATPDTTADPSWLDASPVASTALVHAWRRRYQGLTRALVGEYPEAAPGTLPDPMVEPGAADALAAETATRVGRAARALLRELDVDHTCVGDQARDAFVLGLVQAITAVADAPPAPAEVLGVVYGAPAKRPRTHRRKSPKKKKTVNKRTRKKGR